jgi:hypothetical protein
MRRLPRRLLLLLLLLLALLMVAQARGGGGGGGARAKTKRKERRRRRRTKNTKSKTRKKNSAKSAKSAENAKNHGDGSVCFNGCSGHGACREYHCACADGYHGEDCSWTFVAGGGGGGGATPRRARVGDSSNHDMIPPPAILSVGSVPPLTARSFRRATRDAPVLLVGFSSYSCTRCIAVEREYALALPKLDALGVPFARVNTDAERRLLRDRPEFENIFPPAIFVCGNRAPFKPRCLQYDGLHLAEDIVAFARRVRGDVAPRVASMHGILDVLSSCAKPLRPGGAAGTSGSATPDFSAPALSAESVAIGFFSGRSNFNRRLGQEGVGKNDDDDDDDDDGDDEEAEDAGEHDEFMEAAENLFGTTRIAMAQVYGSPDLLTTFLPTQKNARSTKRRRMKKNKNKSKKDADPRPWIKRTPALVVIPCHDIGYRNLTGKEAFRVAGEQMSVRYLDENVADEDAGGRRRVRGLHQQLALHDWILQKSIPIVAELTPSNYPIYETRGLPMVILFLDLVTKSDRAAGDGRGDNAAPLLAFRKAAMHFRDDLSFVYADGVLYKDRMRGLGILDGPEALPAVAINTKGDGKPVIPLSLSTSVSMSAAAAASSFPMTMPLGPRLFKYCHQFLSGRLQLWDKDAGPSATGKAREQARAAMGTAEADQVVGIREHFDALDDGVVLVSTADGSFQSVAMDETKDVVLLLHTEDGSCAACENMAPYYKRVALRMSALGIDSVVVARMDVSTAPPPSNMEVSTLPAVVLLRAFKKEPPFLYYSGVAKVRPMMDWIQEHAGKPFEFGVELPQFDARDRELFKEQIVEREEARRAAAEL